MKLKKLLLLLIASFAIKCTSKVYTMERYQKTNDRPAADLTRETASEEIEQLISLAKNAAPGVQVIKECIYEQKNSNNDTIKIDNHCLTFPIQSSNGKVIKFNAFLYRNNETIGKAELRFSPIYKDAEVERLHIFSSEERAKGYGSLLFACSIKKLIDLGCTKVSIKADPSDLTENQSWSKMLPKLINFYKQLGAEPDHELYIPYSLPVPEPCRYLCLKDITKAREGIYKILEERELKNLQNSAQTNNIQALARAGTIINHLIK